MVFRFLLIIILSFLAFSSFTQSDSTSISLETIENDSLREFLKQFKPTALPFSILEPVEEDVLDMESYNYFLNQNMEDGDLGYGNHYYGNIFLLDNYIALTITRYFTPGAFGINNYYIELHTIDSTGQLLDYKDLGCFCSDINAGSNEIFFTQLEINVDSNRVYVNETLEHEYIVDPEDDKEYAKPKNRKNIFYLNEEGKIEEVEKSEK